MLELHFKEFGDKNATPLLILHGLYGCSDNWVSIAKELSKEYYVITPDLRNHGQSPHSNIHDFHSMTEDIEALLEKLNITKLNIVGHSMGGKLAMAFTVKHQAMVNKLIVLDISPKPIEDSEETPKNVLFHQKLLHDLSLINLDNVQTYAEAEAQLQNIIEDDRLSAFILTNIKKTDSGLEWKINLNVLKNNLPKITGAIFTDDLQQEKILVPSLFLRGELSDYIPIEDFNFIHTIFSNSEIISIPQAGHWLHSEQKQMILNNILYFLESE